MRLFAGLDKNLNNSTDDDGGGVRYHPRIYPSESGTPALSDRPHSSHKSSTFTPLVLVSFCLLGIKPSSNSSSKATRRMSSFSVGSIHFAAIGKHTLEFIVLAIWVRSALFGDIEDAMSEMDVLQQYRRLGFGVSVFSWMKILAGMALDLASVV
jgi:hypothetical protein